MNLRPKLHCPRGHGIVERVWEGLQLEFGMRRQEGVDNAGRLALCHGRDGVDQRSAGFDAALAISSHCNWRAASSGIWAAKVVQRASGLRCQ